MTEVTLPAPVGVVDCPPGFWAMESEKLVAENERPPSWLRLKGAEAGTIVFFPPPATMCLAS